jgi:hypothetical protein
MLLFSDTKYCESLFDKLKQVKKNKRDKKSKKVRKNENDENNEKDEKETEAYQTRLNQHHQNACAHVKNTGLIYDAICLAQHKSENKWAWQYDQAENHPAILKLCAFWACYQSESNECNAWGEEGEQKTHEARIPYLQFFVGQEAYLPMIPDVGIMPLILKDKTTKENVKEASVIFGDAFLVTYLAGRHITAGQSKRDCLLHYTVNNQPFLKERLVFGEMNLVAFDIQNQLACQTLKALSTFPKRFPTLWRQLKQEHEVKKNEIH